MICAGIPSVDECACRYVTERLMLEVPLDFLNTHNSHLIVQHSEAQAREHFTRLINESMNASSTVLNHVMHGVADWWRSGGSRRDVEPKLSFAQKLVSISRDEPRIRAIDVQGVVRCQNESGKKVVATVRDSG